MSMCIEDPRCWSVYVHTSPSGKVYVGVTSVLPRKRWNYGYGYRNTPFFEDIKKYGWNNIAHDVVKNQLTRDEAYELETTLIEKFDATNPKHGYNRAKGGYGSTGVVISEETRERLVKSHLGKKNAHTPEWNKKIAESNKGKRKPHVGVPRSEECRKKIAAGHSIGVCQYDKNMCLINTFESIKEASRKLKIKNQNISACCKGKTKTAGGFIWKYLK